MAICTACGGQGNQWLTCNVCNGKGPRTCICAGMGKVLVTCPTCRGSGQK